MRIDRVYLENFRNYAAQTVTFHPACNVICGENAQGKTNLLEALCCLSCAKSHRTRTDKELIRFGAEGFVLQGITQTIRLRSITFSGRANLCPPVLNLL